MVQDVEKTNAKKMELHHFGSSFWEWSKFLTEISLIIFLSHAPNFSPFSAQAYFHQQEFFFFRKSTIEVARQQLWTAKKLGKASLESQQGGGLKADRFER